MIPYSMFGDFAQLPHEIITAIAETDAECCRRIWLWMSPLSRARFGRWVSDGFLRSLRDTVISDEIMTTTLFGRLHSFDDEPSCRSQKLNYRQWHHLGVHHRVGGPAIAMFGRVVTRLTCTEVTNLDAVIGNYQTSIMCEIEQWLRHGEFFRDEGHCITHFCGSLSTAGAVRDGVNVVVPR